jgi:cytochrome c peroxidase
VNDLAALYVAGLIQKRLLADRGPWGYPTSADAAKGPRGIAVSPDGTVVACAVYYAGSVWFVDADLKKGGSSLAVGENPKPDLRRAGEICFHDATLCFQHWLSCATCHPEGRVDGLNWDLLNDGIGTPKNTKSLLLSHETPPVMSQGVRDTMEAATKAGYRHILFREPEEHELRETEAYLRALTPGRSPLLTEAGELSPPAQRGKTIFESEKTKCASCHTGKLSTDLKSYDVGTRGEFDRVSEFDTPTLIELWRSAPYLHDGAAATLEEVLTTCNKADRHGVTSHLSPEEVKDLVAYLLSL